MVDLDPVSPPHSGVVETDRSTPPADRDPLETLSLELGRLGRITHVMKAHSAGLGPPGIDHAAFGLLMTLLKGGPQRQGELAGAALLDPSTVSRHIAQLVKAGLVERRADAVDGRAVQLCASNAGVAFGEELVARRRALIQDVLGGWQTDDVETLARLLRKFNDHMEESRELLKAWPTHARTETPQSTHESQEN